MNTNTMRIISAFILNVCLIASVCAQTVSNVVARQEENTIRISYHLSGSAEISLVMSRDGGITYDVTPKTLKGDLGFQQGGNKVIEWDVLADVADLEVERARFKVIAKKVENVTFTVKGVSFTMIAVEGGTFLMGCPDGQNCENLSSSQPAHNVTLHDYYIGRTEVTQGLWEAVMGSNPSYHRGNSYPVEQVSWYDCQDFVKKLNTLLASQLRGRRFAMPTEAQWEFAARGGRQSKHYKFAGSNDLKSVGWMEKSDYTADQTHVVAQKAPNELGTYDMSGNVWEWCRDWYEKYSGLPQTDPTGPTSGKYRICRGGSCHDSNYKDYCYFNVAYRCTGPSENTSYHTSSGEFNCSGTITISTPDLKLKHLGFRLALVF